MQKRILIPTVGTRGDIQPYLFLAKELNKVGYETVIASHPCWESLVESEGVKFHKIGPNVNIEHEAAVIRSNSKNWILGMIKTMNFIFKIMEESSVELKELCNDFSLVVASHSHYGALEAEASDTPFISVTIQPSMIPNELTKNKLKERLVGLFLNPMMVRPYNKLRRKLGLKKVKTFYDLVSPTLNIIPISSVVYPPKSYWSEKNKVVGYWFTEEDTSYVSEQELVDFLNSGEPPIVLSLGAMSFESQKENNKLDIFINAFKDSGMRAIIQGFNETIKDYNLPSNMISIGSVPHNFLFKHAYCVIHHGGFGTTAATLKSGVPSLIIPHVLDQYEWANKVYDLKVSPKPISIKDLSQSLLIDTLKELKENYDFYNRNVKDISNKIAKEDGLKVTINLIKEIL